MTSNCLFFAFKKLKTDGGYLILRRSHVGWWPHFVWSKDLLTFEEFVPTEAPYERLVPPIMFDGYVRPALTGAPGPRWQEFTVRKTIFNRFSKCI